MSRNGNKGKAYYDGREIEFEIPESWNVVAMAEPRAVSELEDISAEVKRGFRNPINAKSLAELASSGMKVAIISEDQTRPSPVGEVVLPLLEELNTLGIADERLR